MENFRLNKFNDNEQLAPNSGEKKLNSNLTRIMDIETFEKGVRTGQYSDDKGVAYLILNGTLYNSYNIYIDRRCITKAGSVVSFEWLLKNYKPEEIQIRYDAKEQKLPSLKYYRSNKDK